MARYTGPVNKKSRRYKFSILENNKEFLKGKKRTTIPGQHGDKRSKKLSSYGEHLYEKQKLKFMYGLSEKQMKKNFERALKLQGVIGENFLFLLESRLDNIIYRAGIANTRRQARQFVNHGHVLVNGKKVDIPSYIVKVGDEFQLKPKLLENNFVKENIKNLKKVLFVEYDAKKNIGKFVRRPNRNELTGQISEPLIVEFYNK